MRRTGVPFFAFFCLRHRRDAVRPDCRIDGVSRRWRGGIDYARSGSTPPYAIDATESTCTPSDANAGPRHAIAATREGVRVAPDAADAPPPRRRPRLRRRRSSKKTGGQGPRIEEGARGAVEAQRSGRDGLARGGAAGPRARVQMALGEAVLRERGPAGLDDGRDAALERLPGRQAESGEGVVGEGADPDAAPVFGEYRSVTAKTMALNKHWDDLINETAQLRAAEEARLQAKKERRIRRRNRYNLAVADRDRRIREKEAARLLMIEERQYRAKDRVKKRFESFIREGLRGAWLTWLEAYFDKEELKGERDLQGQQPGQESQGS